MILPCLDPAHFFFVDPNKFNLDPERDKEYWPNLDPDPDPDPGLGYRF